MLIWGHTIYNLINPELSYPAEDVENVQSLRNKINKHK